MGEAHEVGTALAQTDIPARVYKLSSLSATFRDNLNSDIRGKGLAQGSHAFYSRIVAGGTRQLWASPGLFVC